MRHIEIDGRRTKKLLTTIEVYKNNKRFDCGKCQEKHCDETKEIDGSIGPSPIHNKYEIIDVYVSNVCPKPTITPLSNQFIRLFLHYKNNILPFVGGIYDQSNAYIEAMEIIDSQWDQQPKK